MEWTAEAQENNGVLRVKLSLTHEELAQLIGCSRESVSRSLGEFRPKFHKGRDVFYWFLEG